MNARTAQNAWMPGDVRRKHAPGFGAFATARWRASIDTDCMRRGQAASDVTRENGVLSGHLRRYISGELPKPRSFF